MKRRVVGKCDETKRKDLSQVPALGDSSRCPSRFGHVLSQGGTTHMRIWWPSGVGPKVLPAPVISHIPSAWNNQYIKEQYLGIVCPEPQLLIIEGEPDAEVRAFYPLFNLMFPQQVGPIILAWLALSLRSDLKWQLFWATFPSYPA